VRFGTWPAMSWLFAAEQRVFGEPEHSRVFGLAVVCVAAVASPIDEEMSPGTPPLGRCKGKENYYRKT
jgi:hypothetical protein